MFLCLPLPSSLVRLQALALLLSLVYLVLLVVIGWHTASSCKTANTALNSRALSKGAGDMVEVLPLPAMGCTYTLKQMLCTAAVQ